MHPVIEDQELPHFLRARRGAVQPADVGLPPGGRRRTPGLRREEVAMLAGVSRQHANLALTRLRREGIVNTSHQGIEVRNLDGLLVFASD